MLPFLQRQLFYSLAGLFLFAGFVWLLFLFNGPESITKIGRIGYFETEGLQYFPVRQLPDSIFWVIRLGFPLTALLFGTTYLRFRKTASVNFAFTLFRWPGKIRNFVSAEINSLSKMQKTIAALTFVLLAAERTYYLFQFPIHTDEAASYLLFIRNGFFTTATFYPIPNNHLLQNLLAVPLTWIFQEPFWVLRLPPFLLSLLLTLVCFFALKRLSGFTIAYLATGLFSFGWFTLFLATQGRGYILLTLLTVLAFSCSLQALRARRAGYWSGFSFISALGFYTVPTFLYPFAATLLFCAAWLLFQKKWYHLMPLIGATFFALAGTGVLYTPLLLVSGKETLFNNKYVQALTPTQFTVGLGLYLKEAQGSLLGDKSGIGMWSFLISTGLLLVMLIFRNRPFLKKLLPRQAVSLIGFSLMVSVAVYFLLRMQLLLPPPRVLFFKSFSDFLGLALVLAVPAKLLFRNQNLLAVFLFIGVLTFAGTQLKATEFFLKDYPQPYYNFPALVKQVRESGAEKVYLDEPFYQLFLQYEYARFEKEVQIDTKKVRQVTYDFLILEHGKPFPKPLADSLYQQVYADELVKAYRLKQAW